METNNIKTDLETFEGEMADARRSQTLIMNRYLAIFFVIFSIVISVLALPPSTWLVATRRTDAKINPLKDPIQVDMVENIYAADLSHGSDYQKLIKMQNLKKDTVYYIMPLAKYSLSGRLIEKNKFFPWNFGDFDKIALVDLGIVWGDLSKDEYFPKLSAHSQQTGDARQLVIFFKDQYKQKYSNMHSYVYEHGSHTHVIPSNKKVMQAINALKYGQNVKIEGYLVDVYNSNRNRIAMSSLSRTDFNESSRGHNKGGGACEVMYVSRVQIGKKIFE